MGVNTGFTTKLRAVNDMRRAAKLLEADSLGGSGTWPSRAYASDETGEAERLLDEVSSRYQMDGPEDLWKPIEVTVPGTPYAITFDAAENLAGGVIDENTVQIRGNYKNANIRVTIRGDSSDSNNMKLWDIDRGTFSFQPYTGGTLYLENIELLDFENLPEHHRNAIMVVARQEFVRRYRNNPQEDQQLEQEKGVILTAAERVRQQTMERPRDNGGTSNLALTGAITPQGGRDN